MIFHPNSKHPWQYFITSCWQEKVGFSHWTLYFEWIDNLGHSSHSDWISNVNFEIGEAQIGSLSTWRLISSNLPTPANLINSALTKSKTRASLFAGLTRSSPSHKQAPQDVFYTDLSSSWLMEHTGVIRVRALLALTRRRSRLTKEGSLL